MRETGTLICWATTVEITGEVIQDEAAGVPVRYYHLERNKFDCVQSCQGDLIVICNALADYAGLLSEYLEEEGEHMNACGRIQYELHIRRCLKIEKLISEQIGYDREAAIEKCRKKNHRKEEDVGEDAVVLAARRKQNTSARKTAQEQTDKKN